MALQSLKSAVEHRGTYFVEASGYLVKINSKDYSIIHSGSVLLNYGIFGVIERTIHNIVNLPAVRD